MHWVDRGPEPSSLESVRSQFTQPWVEHYRHGIGNRPTPRWRQFHDELRNVFHELCAYCEEETGGEVDHFKPVSKFPHLVYDWSNWIFSCHACNHSKLNKWPSNGFINPCAENPEEHPERAVAFDTTTGRLIPKAGIPPEQRERVRRMVCDVGLNDSFHLKRRMYWVKFLRHHINSQVDDTEDEQEFLGRIVERSSPLSSITRALMDEMGFDVVE